MKQLLVLNPENIPEELATTFRRREASRAVIFDESGNVALLHATVNGYHKLPGGGIDLGETPESALIREAQEEIGCAVEIVAELGTIVEYRKHSQLHQISYCYLAKVVGLKGEPSFTEKEKSEGLEVVWLPLTEALKVTAAGDRTTHKSMYVIPRELALLNLVASLGVVV